MGENSRNGNLCTPTPLGLSLGAVELFQYQQLAYSGSRSTNLQRYPVPTTRQLSITQGQSSFAIPFLLKTFTLPLAQSRVTLTRINFRFLSSPLLASKKETTSTQK
jgi:hypothetical protein